MNTDNLRVKWIEVEASVWEAQQAEVKALREDSAKAWAAVRSSNQVTIAERKMRDRIAALESQLAELRQGGEVVGYVSSGLINGKCSAALAYKERQFNHQVAIYTRPQPAIPPGYAVVPIEPTEEMIDAGLVGIGQPSYVTAAIYKNMLASAPAIQPQAASVSVAEKDSPEYQRGFKDGYQRRDDEVMGSLA